MSPGVSDFFEDCPTEAPQLPAKVESFIKQQAGCQGGTAVPLEKRCVRFIDNFSGGTRGALSTEAFLEAGYAVIFLNRRHSIQPFTKGLPSGEIMDTLTDVLDCNGGSTLRVKDDASNIVRQAVAKAKQVAAENRLLRISFETLHEYLKFLQIISLALRSSGKKILFYLAAAVSDFYIPWSDLADHKIQSSAVDSNLLLKLTKVPKMLGELRHHWAPEAFVVSFKLETDDDILIQKACTSIKNYGVHAVVANILETRKDKVYIVHEASNQDLRAETVTKKQAEVFIENDIVDYIVSAHRQYYAP